MLAMGYMEGAGGRFSAGTALSRAQLAAILYRAAGSPRTEGGSAFADVAPGLWYSDAVAWAAARGVVTGGDDGLFRPDRAVTREQLAVMLFRFAGGTASGTETLLACADGDQVSGYAAEAVAWAVEQRLMEGVSAGGQTVLNPGGTATRGECAQLLARFLTGAGAK